MDLFPAVPPPPVHARSRPKPPNIQDSFLFGHLKDGSILAFALVSGKAVQGRIQRFDRYTLLVESSGRETLVYKHAIVAITETPG